MQPIVEGLTGLAGLAGCGPAPGARHNGQEGEIAPEAPPILGKSGHTLNETGALSLARIE